MTILDPRQKAWFAQASMEDRACWLSRGEPSALEYYNERTQTLSFAPALRGVRVGDQCDSMMDALDASAAQRDAYIAEFGDRMLDEVGLKIDGANWLMAEACDEHIFRIETILHLASMMAERSAGPLIQFLDDLTDGSVDIKPLTADLPFLPALLAEDREGGSLAEDFFEDAINEQTLGFLLQVAQPTLRRSQHGGQSYSWGAYQTTWVYGHSYAEAFERAKDWAASRIAMVHAAAG